MFWERFKNYSTVSFTVSAMQKKRKVCASGFPGAELCQNVQETFRNFSPIPERVRCFGSQSCSTSRLAANLITDIAGVSWEV